MGSPKLTLLLPTTLALLLTAACQSATGTKSDSGGGSGPQAGATATPVDLAQRCATKSDAKTTTAPSNNGYDLLAPSTATWTDVKNLIQASCIGSCHTHDKYLTYDGAHDALDAMIQRTDKAPSETGFMPQGGQKLSLDDRMKLIVWSANGAPNDGGGATAPADDSGTAGANNDVGTPDGKSRFEHQTEAVPADNAVAAPDCK